MAHFNLEKNMREKLENRELNPSPDAWKKLEAQLGKSQPKKKTVGWYYIAASLVGLLIAASVFLNSNTTEVENRVVKENVDQKNGIQIETELVSNLPKSTVEENSSEKSKVENEPKQTTNNIKPHPSQKQSAVDKKIKKSEVIADIGEEKNPINLEEYPENSIIEKDDIFNSKVDEVVASVKLLQDGNKEVTTSEVEALLANARREMQSQRILKSSKVDATALLQDVEWELEKSFRDKVFDALGQGFNKIRTAVLERND